MTPSVPESVLSAISAKVEPLQSARLDDPQPVAAGGLSGNPLFRIRARWDSPRGEVHGSYIVKRPSWSPVSYFFGGDPGIEARLFEQGVIRAVNAVAGVHAPLLAVVRDEDAVWLIMEDVSAELEAWRDRMSVPPLFKAERVLIDRLARLHVSWERPQALALMDQVGGLVNGEQRARWCEKGYRVWFAGDTPPAGEAESSQRAWDSVQWARAPVAAFLDWLSIEERKRWKRHMTCRDAVLRTSSGLPETLIHGDATPENVGLYLSGPQETLVLIDWELTGPGIPAWELVHHLWNPPLRPATNEPGLFDYYYQRYCLHGGTAMDRTLWERSVNVALAQWGVGMLPIHAGMALMGDDKAQIATARGMTDSVCRAFATLGL